MTTWALSTRWLAGWCALASSAHRIGEDVAARRPLAAVEPGQVGDERLHQEPPPGLQPGRHPLEAPQLVVLAEEREEGVEDHVDEPAGRLPGDVREVADGHVDPGPAGLGPQLRHHRVGGVDPEHGDAACSQREGEAAGADAELEGRAAAGELGQQVDRRLRLGGELVEVVVDVRDAVAVGPGAVRADAGRRSQRSPGTSCQRAQDRAQGRIHRVVRREPTVDGVDEPGVVERDLRGRRPAR